MKLLPAQVITRTGLLLMFLLVSSSALQAQDEHIETHTLTTKDRWPIHITYYKHAGNRDTPVVILLHDQRGDRRVWTAGFANQLWTKGYAVIAADLRKHGESKLDNDSGNPSDVGDVKPDDYKKMVAYDMDAIKDFIFSEHQEQNLNMRKTGIIAPEFSSIIALNFAMVDWQQKPYDDAPTPQMRTPRGQDIRAMVLISPMNSVRGLTTVAPLRLMRNGGLPIAFLFCVGAEDTLDKGETQRLYNQIAGRNPADNDRVFYESYPYNLRGMALFGKGLKIEPHIEIFLEKNLLELDDEWVDRRSRLQR
ncbi:hypothetical protein [Rubinisphaera sp.]|uniref:alpha/beta hydrolase n=1 Tax=Rubinisphaera sp. TaxID=2024857 RepID=UPI000C103E2D|nr:hypothetical protein [Rubinisphaera sp.]MBV08877.1 hypothetical protein [Rubinisphaera sp.]HCS54972.1 hypothetical protein [Planctomycetaceae bacterium]|tara:strand:- start:1575 stop:2495 length:921 start_codon:yes stop_codon:yes gene_type:complete